MEVDNHTGNNIMAWVILRDSSINMSIHLHTLVTNHEVGEYTFQGDVHCYGCYITYRNFCRRVPITAKRIWFGCDKCGIALCFEVEVPRHQIQNPNHNSAIYRRP